MNRAFLETPGLLALLAAVACGGGGGSPTQSTPLVHPLNQPGHVVATNTTTPVPGAHVSTALASADTNGNGDFTLVGPATPSTSQSVTVTAAGYVTRETTMRMPRTTPVNLDLISTSPPFDQTFFDAMARGGMTGNSYQLYRWDHQLTFYVRTTDENGRPLSNSELDIVRRGIREGVQYYTNNTFQAQIEEGTGTKEGVTGYVTVLPMRVLPSGDYCSHTASVGGDPNVTQLRMDGCGCRGISIPIIEVIHAVGNVVGMWHVPGEDNLMYNTIPAGCQDLLPTPKEQFHAALIYARPRGNLAPDKDPNTFALSTSPHGGGPEATTRRR